MSMAETLRPHTVSGLEGASPGRRLSEAREAQNLAAADVARQLKLSVGQVEALESGRYQQLPGPIFVRGFIRNYARLLKLDPDELVRVASNDLPRQAALPQTPPSQEIPFPTAIVPRWPKYAAAAVAIFGVLAAYEFIWNEPSGPATWTVEVTSVPVAPKAKSAEASQPVQLAGEPGAAQPAISAATAAEPIPNAPAAADVPPVAESTSRPGEKQVRLEFDQESWVEIRDRRQQVIFSKLNYPGTTQQVTGMPPFSVVVGNAHGVKLTYGEQVVDLSHYTKINVARLILE